MGGVWGGWGLLGGLVVERTMIQMWEVGWGVVLRGMVVWWVGVCYFMCCFGIRVEFFFLIGRCELL